MVTGFARTTKSRARLRNRMGHLQGFNIVILLYESKLTRKKMEKIERLVSSGGGVKVLPDSKEPEQIA
jgi:hypothetical protein